MLKDLIKISNRLDAKGLATEANYLDNIIIKISSDDKDDDDDENILIEEEEGLLYEEIRKEVDILSSKLFESIDTDNNKMIDESEVSEAVINVMFMIIMKENPEDHKEVNLSRLNGEMRLILDSENPERSLLNRLKEHTPDVLFPSEEASQWEGWTDPMIDNDIVTLPDDDVVYEE